MPYTMEEFKREFLREHPDELSPEERLKGLPLEERLKGFSMDDLFRALSQDELKSLAERIRQERDKNSD
ncbi:MAG: hypothetical protein KY475_15890 [Planctomycetes bacterium]|nr:hypothetical protein [Planctomycetota bacterium]